MVANSKQYHLGQLLEKKLISKEFISFFVCFWSANSAQNSHDNVRIYYIFIYVLLFIFFCPLPMTQYIANLDHVFLDSWISHCQDPGKVKYSQYIKENCPIPIWCTFCILVKIIFASNRLFFLCLLILGSAFLIVEK